MAAETGFKIDGAFYDVPSIDTLTMDEAQVLYDYAGLTLEDFVGDDLEHDADLAAKLKNPGFMRALAHIAYQRANPRLASGRVKTLVGGSNLFELVEHLPGGDEQDGDAVPPASTTEPDKPSLSGSVESNATSGPASTPSSDAPAAPLAITGITGSATSSISARKTSAA